MTLKRLRVALPVPGADGFDYRWDGPGAPPVPGTRVRVPLGKQQRIGIVIEATEPLRIDESALKPVGEVLDDGPLFDAELMQSLTWAARYYHHSLGEVLLAAIPGPLRKGKPSQPPPADAWIRTAAGRNVDIETIRRRAPRQAELLIRLQTEEPVRADSLRTAGVTADSLRRLADRELIERIEVQGPEGLLTEADPVPTETPPELTPDQRQAVATGLAATGFTTLLLHGVTGSGKTEVFLRLISAALERGQQCLLLVPEIGLTPQLVSRLEARFGGGLAVFHSGLSATERLKTWRDARSGAARLIVGTRSAAFAPMPKPGLIVVDEEHDTSYKQQSSLRYSGRDLAIMRASALDIPIVLASATPSLESLRNAAEGKYQLVSLPQRIGAGGHPALRVIDLNRHAARNGLSTPLITAMEQHLKRGNQVLLFINRRGFAPVLFCPNCEKSSECGRCDARLTIHASAGQLRCHHCGRTESLHWACPDCSGERIAVGSGTERITAEIGAMFSEHGIARLDRDAVTNRDQLGQALSDIESRRARIIVGTQLLTKGHDFPAVTLVGVLNADQGLFGVDFRSEERLAQTIVQVAGRAGRREERGEVLIQTHYPNHPLLQRLLAQGYADFAEHALEERRQTGWPPFSHLAVFRAEATGRDHVFAFLHRLRRHLGAADASPRVLGPTPDWMERREGRYRAQLLLQSPGRGRLHAAIRSCLTALPNWRETRRVRWSIDVDPAEL